MLFSVRYLRPNKETQRKTQILVAWGEMSKDDEYSEFVVQLTRSELLFKDANKWGTLMQRTKWAINEALEGVVLTASGILEAVLWTFLKSYALFIFFYYGIITGTFRILIMKLVLLAATFSTVIADIIDAILDFMNVGIGALVDGVNLGRDFVNHDLLSPVNDVLKTLHIHTIPELHFETLRWTNIPGVSPDQVKAWLTGLPPTCMNFDSAWKIILYLIRLTGHATMCPTVRFFYPLEKTYNTDVMPTLFGWTYYGSADPVLHDPTMNCMGDNRSLPNSGVDSAVQRSLDYTCICLGITYLFLEVFITIVLIRALLQPLLRGLSKFFFLGTYIVAVVARGVPQVVAVTIKEFMLA